MQLAMKILPYKIHSLSLRWEDLGVQVMETMKRELGQEHPDTLTNMNNLA